MPNTVLESRVRAAYRAQACAAAVAVGAQVFSMGAGIAVTLCLNAAYLSALAALPMAAITAFVCQRALRRQAAHTQEEYPRSGMLARGLYALLTLTLMANAVFSLSAMVNLVERSLLPEAGILWITGFSLLAVGLCALSGGTGASRLSFMLRWILLAGLILLCGKAMSFDSPVGFFPLLGTGAGPLGIAALSMPGSASAALMLMLPPPALREAGEAARRCPVPRPGFFIGRVLAGAAVSIVLLAALALCNSYELLRSQQTWGERMFILCSNEPREGIFQTLLTLLQIIAMALCAVNMLCASEQAAARVWPALGSHRAGLLLCLVLCLAVLYGLIRFGFVLALYAAPFLLIPLVILLLCSKRM